METKRFVIGTAVGASTVLAIGFSLFALPLLRNFYLYAMNAGSATGVPRESPLVWAVFVGALSYGALVTLAIGSRPGRVAAGAGMRIGAIVGFLLWCTANFMLFGISNVSTLTSTIIGSLLELVPGAMAGGIVALVLDRLNTAGLSHPAAA
jgi:hypothetical protein